METVVLLQNPSVELLPSPATTYLYEIIHPGLEVIFRETKAVANLFQNLSNQGGIQVSPTLLNRTLDTQNELQIEIGIGQRGPYNGNGGYKGFIKVLDVRASGILENLYKQYGGCLKLKVDICNIESSRSKKAYGSFTLETGQDPPVVLPSIGGYRCEVDDIPIIYNSSGNASYSIERIINKWQGQSPFKGNLTISAIIPKASAYVGMSVTDALSVNKKILKEEIGWDVIIISKNGVVIKCHKSFLVAHSAVFKAMFQSAMQESNTSTVEIPDMSEASVRALLAYLYYWEIKKAAKWSLICFELFYAGHKYDIGRLEECMKNILLSKENDWYDVDVAMRLFLFSRNLPEGNDLKLKAVQVLKSKLSILETSDSYQELFKKDPKAAMELCKYAFSV